MPKDSHNPFQQDWRPVNVGHGGKNNPVTKSKIVKPSGNNSTISGKVIRDDDELPVSDKVGIAIGKQIAQARNAKKLTQKDFAQKLNQIKKIANVQNLVQEYENGKAIRNNAILAAMERVLGVKFNR